ncbi:MAG: hypothetical protein COA78_29320 [Blastopirellula sp.]|nr:MAG: hypothetical protein COA78_29320 [Blastopirellula sp.]
MTKTQSTNYLLEISFPGGFAETRVLNKLLSDMFKNAEGRTKESEVERFTGQRIGRAIYYWQVMFSDSISAYKSAERAYQLYAELLKNSTVLFFEGKIQDDRSYFQAWVDEKEIIFSDGCNAITILSPHWNKYKMAGGKMELLEFLDDSLQAGGIERVYVDEGLSRENAPTEPSY